MAGTIFNVTYRVTDENGEPAEEVIEIRAVSEEQAVFLAPCSPDDILFVECAVAKRAAAL